jgi:3-oxoacyl-[acyl-carrier-protein] synthase II
MNRVVITGIGAVTPLGTGKKALWDGVRAGESAVRRIDHFDTTGLKSQIAAWVRDFDARNFMEAKSARRFDRFSLFAVAAARMALDDAELKIDQNDGNGIGTYIGSALGGVANAEAEHTEFVHKGFSAVNRLIALSVFNGAGACNVSITYGLKGPSLSNANSCASGTIAIGEAFRLIKAGQVTAMVAGGAEAPLSTLCFGAFDLIGAMSTRNETPEKASSPFDQKRDGFVMAEGAAVMVLEEREAALKRGARIYAELLGYGVTSDAHHMTIPRPDASQSARAITLALQEAGITPDQIDYVNAHGSSTPLNDKTETLAIKKALGEDVARRMPISATKAMHGHALGASGAIEIAIGLLAMENDYIPPTINLVNADSECDLDYVPSTGRTKKIRTLLSHSFGFGGSNAALILQRVIQ